MILTSNKLASNFKKNRGLIENCKMWSIFSNFTNHLTDQLQHGF